MFRHTQRCCVQLVLCALQPRHQMSIQVCTCRRKRMESTASFFLGRGPLPWCYWLCSLVHSRAQIITSDLLSHNGESLDVPMLSSDLYAQKTNLCPSFSAQQYPVHIYGHRSMHIMLLFTVHQAVTGWGHLSFSIPTECTRKWPSQDNCVQQTNVFQICNVNKHLCEPNNSGVLRKMKWKQRSVPWPLLTIWKQ